MDLILSDGVWEAREFRWVHRFGIDEVFFEVPPDDARGDFTRAVHAIRAFSVKITDGDNAIKARVFSFLFKRLRPWYVYDIDHGYVCREIEALRRAEWFINAGFDAPTQQVLTLSLPPRITFLVWRCLGGQSNAELNRVWRVLFQ